MKQTHKPGRQMFIGNWQADVDQLMPLIDSWICVYIDADWQYFNQLQLQMFLNHSW